MTEEQYNIVGDSYKSTADVPKDYDLFYKCLDCDTIIPSVPDDNIGCECGNVYIDRDYWRLVVVNFKKFVVLKKEG